MFELIEFLSGEIPGGILILLFILAAVNLTYILLKSSKIISPEKCRKKQLTYSLICILLYAVLWFALKPPLPQIRILVLPTVSQDGKLQISDQAFTLAELMERRAFDNLADKYLMHRWQWLFETIGEDSAANYKVWKSIAGRMNAGLIIESAFDADNNINCTVYSYQDEEEIKCFTADAKTGLSHLIEQLNKEYEIYQTGLLKDNPINKNYLNAKTACLKKDYHKTQALLKDREDAESKILLAASHMKKGLAIKIDREKAQYTKIVNNEFEKAKKILYEVIRKRQDTPEAAYILGRIALREDNYEDAELFLKKALVEDPSNCRIHYALSYLLSVRLQELGYENRLEILQKAVYLDPGYTKAVYALAREYFSKGTGTQAGAGTTMAMRVIEDFFKIKSDDPQILSLLASLYLKTDRTDDALSIFSKLQERFPNDSNSYYNLGIVFFQKKKYPQALEYFLKAINMDNNLDAYLYAAVTYRQMSKRDLALKYYRERVKRKTGNDDKYAKEAMMGIRKILDEIAREEENINEK